MDGYLIVCIAYLTKYSDVKPIKDKTALTVAVFLYEFMYRHAWFIVQINDQEEEVLLII